MTSLPTPILWTDTKGRKNTHYQNDDYELNLRREKDGTCTGWFFAGLGKDYMEVKVKADSEEALALWITMTLLLIEAQKESE
jgi:hypothetical protein